MTIHSIRTEAAQLLGLMLGGAVLMAAAAAPAIARDGDPDPRFGQGGVARLASSEPSDALRPTVVVAQRDGKLLIAGTRSRLNPLPGGPGSAALVVRTDAAGRADPAFGTDPADPGFVELPDLMAGTSLQRVEAMRVLGNGSILLAGTAELFGPRIGFLAKLHADGRLDEDFGDAGIVRVEGTRLHGLEVDGQGRIVVAGHRAADGVASRAVVARYTSGGEPDDDFGDGQGFVLLGTDAPERSGHLFTVKAIDADALLVAGSWSRPDLAGDDFWIHRLDASGRPDPDFGALGRRVFRAPGEDSAPAGIREIVVEPDGRIAFVGYQQRSGGLGLVFGRLNADGSADDGFGDGQRTGYQFVDFAPQAWHRYPTGLVRQNDGRLIASARYETGFRSEFVAVRLSAGGAPDPDFGSGGVAQFDLAPQGRFSDATAIALQAGQPLLTGAVGPYATDGSVVIALLKLENDGIHRGTFD